MQIKDAVLNHFGLSEESKKRFIDAFDNPFIDDVYKDFLDEELRFRFPLPKSVYKDFDRGWETFSSVLPKLVEEYEISYEDFYENRKKLKKGSLRIIKLIRSYLKSPSPREAQDFLEKMRQYEPLKFDEYVRFCDEISCSWKDPGAFNKAVDLFIDRINDLRFSKTKSIEVVLSLNKTDWFLSTTKESWRTCLSLESPSFASYWVSLAGSVVDKNLALLYITNGDKKEYFEDSADRVLSRSWILLDKNSQANAIKFYPNSLISLENINEFFPIKLKEIGDDFVSKHRIDPLKFKNGYTNYIYQDKTNPFDYNDEGFLLRSGSKGLYTFLGKDLFEGPIFDYTGGLSYLISNGYNILRYFAEPIRCEDCGKLVSSKREYNVDRNNYTFCTSCFGQSNRYPMIEEPIDFYGFRDDDFDEDEDGDEDEVDFEALYLNFLGSRAMRATSLDLSKVFADDQVEIVKERETCSKKIKMV